MLVSPEAVEYIFTLFVHPDVLANEEVKLADDPVAVKLTVLVPSNNIKTRKWLMSLISLALFYIWLN